MTWKCRFGSVDSPLFPTSPIGSPPSPCANLQSDAVWAQVGIIAELAVPVIDHDDVSARSIGIDFPRFIFHDVGSYGQDGAILRCQYFLTVGVIIRVMRAVSLKALAVRSDLNEVVSIGLGEIAFVLVEESVFVNDVPDSVKRQAPGQRRVLLRSRHLLDWTFPPACTELQQRRTRRPFQPDNQKNIGYRLSLVG